MRMQQNALAIGSSNGALDAGDSFAYISAPRNSLVIKFKPEAHAAVNRAFHMLRAELSYHSHHMRDVSAYELIEGNDAALTHAFSTLCAHLLFTVA